MSKKFKKYKVFEPKWSEMPSEMPSEICDFFFQYAGAPNFVPTKSCYVKWCVEDSNPFTDWLLSNGAKHFEEVLVYHNW